MRNHWMQKTAKLSPDSVQRARIALWSGLIVCAIILISVPIRHFLSPLHPAMWIEASVGLAYCLGEVVAVLKSPGSVLPGYLVVASILIYLPGPLLRNDGVNAPILSFLFCRRLSPPSSAGDVVLWRRS